LHNEYDNLQTELEQERKSRKGAEADLTKAVEEMAALKVSLAEVTSEQKTMAEVIDACKKEIEELEEEKERVEKEREAERMMKEVAAKEKMDAEIRLENLQKEMKAVEEKHVHDVKEVQGKLSESQAKLERFTKEAKQHSMMDLEIADYERTVQNLNAIIDEHKKLEEEKETEIRRLEEKVTSLSKQLGELSL
jgi:chromosome segregation ATPase